MTLPFINSCIIKEFLSEKLLPAKNSKLPKFSDFCNIVYFNYMYFK